MNAITHQANLPFNLPKLLSSIILGGIITFALFALMHKLTSNDTLPLIEPKDFPIIDLTANFEEEPVIERPKLKPKPKAEPQPKVIPKIIEHEPNTEVNKHLFAVNLSPVVAETQIRPNFTNPDGGATPIIRVEPKYPAPAARDGIEGWVRLSFSISKAGTVDNIRVIDAEPRRVFNQAAKRALAKWKYKPNIVAGQPQVQNGMMVMLDFKLAS